MKRLGKFVIESQPFSVLIGTTNEPLCSLFPGHILEFQLAFKTQDWVLLHKFLRSSHQDGNAVVRHEN